MQLSDQLVDSLRNQFPALARRVGNQTAVFLDGPAGTQVPQRVIDAMTHYLATHNANRGGAFATSVESDRLLDAAHEAAADFLGAGDPDTVAFGANMTTLTFALSRALARTWTPGDEIVLTRMEHDANYTPWTLAARDVGVTVRHVDIDPADCTLRLEEYAEVLNDRTRLVAVTCASNATGTLNPVKRICQWAREAGALSFLDAVHYAPHAQIDVEDWGCDFLACSAYKFFGPHVGMLYGRRELLESLQPFKLRPAPDSLPGKWMTGTQNHASIAGVMAAIDYLADIGRAASGDASLARRAALEPAFTAIGAYERSLADRLLNGLAELPRYQVWGITNREDRGRRLPTVALTHESRTARDLATPLAAAGVFAWHGNYYALPLTERLGLEPHGMLRLGLVHYNTPQEVDRVLRVLAG